MWSWRPDCHLWDTCCCAHRLDCRSSGLGAGPRFPSRGALGLRETPLYVSGAGPLVYCLAVLPALKTWTFQRAEINVGCGTNPACPRFSLALGEGESCQQAVSCGKELGFTDIIETPLLGQVLGSVDRLFPSMLPSEATGTSFMDGEALISPGSHFSFGARDIFLWPSS